MFCEKCGKRNEEGAMFCAYCGQKLCETNAQPVLSETDTVSTDENVISKAEAKKVKNKKSKVKIAIIAGCSIFVALIVVVFTVLYFYTESKKINFDDYVYTEIIDSSTLDAEEGTEFPAGFVISGFNGTAKVCTNAADLVNWNKLITDLHEGNQVSNKEYIDYYYLDEYDLSKYFKCKLDKIDNLSNGDTVTLSIAWNEDQLKENFGIFVKGENYSYSYKIEGLKNATILDPFSMLKVTVDGVSSCGVVDISEKTKEKKFGDFSLKCDGKSYGNDGVEMYFAIYLKNEKIGNAKITLAENCKYSNGDYVKFNIETDAKNQYKYCYDFPSSEKMFKVTGLPHYIDANTNLTKENITKIKEFINKAWEYEIRYDGVEELGDFIEIEVYKYINEDETVDSEESYGICAVYNCTTPFDGNVKYAYIDLTNAIEFTESNDIKLNSTYARLDLLTSQGEFNYGTTIIKTYK